MKGDRIVRFVCGSDLTAIVKQKAAQQQETISEYLRRLIRQDNGLIQNGGKQKCDM